MESDVRYLCYKAIKTFADYERLKVAAPNVDFDPSELEGDFPMYLRVMMLPIEPDVLTVCDGGSKYEWIFQVSVYYAKGNGEIKPNEIVDKLRQAFPVNHKLVSRDHSFKVVRPAKASPPVKMTGWFSIPVSIRLQTIC